MWVEAPGIQSKRPAWIDYASWVGTWPQHFILGADSLYFCVYSWAVRFYLPQDKFWAQKPVPASALKTCFQGRGKGPLLGKGRCETQSEEAGAVTKSKGWGNSCLPESPWGSGCFPPCALFACLFRPCETLTCIETVVKSCCAHQQAAYPGLGGQVQRSCPCLPPPVPPLCPLHLPCPLWHLFLLLLLIRWLKNSYNLMGSL